MGGVASCERGSVRDVRTTSKRKRAMGLCACKITSHNMYLVYYSATEGHCQPVVTPKVDNAGPVAGPVRVGEWRGVRRE